MPLYALSAARRSAYCSTNTALCNALSASPLSQRERALTWAVVIHSEGCAGSGQRV